jgi:hypothetical protein
MATTYEDGRFYLGKITRWKLGKSKEKGTPLIEFWVMITGKKEMGKAVPCPAAERPVVRYFTENTIDNVVNDLRTLGYPYDGFDQLDPENAEAYDFENTEVEIKCRHEEYKGEKREKWDFAFSGGGSFVQAIDRKDVSRLNALFGGKFKSAGGTPQPSRPAGPGALATKTTEEQAEEVF